MKPRGSPLILVLAVCGACSGGPELTPLPEGKLVVVNGSFSGIAMAVVTPCDRDPAPDLAPITILPGARWVTELAGGCYRIIADIGGQAVASKPFDLPPSGAYRVVFRDDI